MKPDTSFWQSLTELISTHKIIIDRPKHTKHPHYPDMIYPLDYGYLENTSAGDGDGIDVWIGSLSDKTLTGILCTFDRLKRDAEIKLLLDCTDEDIRIIQSFNTEVPSMYIRNPLVEHAISDRLS